MQKAVDLKVDFITTDNPLQAEEILREKGISN
ncbi:MAG: hypothetical protein H6Q18_145 [Bacteroidetes bacterium]|nr:hypothetical protein [Bacteroidota bacterium]